MDSMIYYEDSIVLELFQIAQLERLGYSRDESVNAVNNGVDWHDVANLIEHGCDRVTALRIAA